MSYIPKQSRYNRKGQPIRAKKKEIDYEKEFFWDESDKNFINDMTSAKNKMGRILKNAKELTDNSEVMCSKYNDIQNHLDAEEGQHMKRYSQLVPKMSINTKKNIEFPNRRSNYDENLDQTIKSVEKPQITVNSSIDSNNLNDQNKNNKI